MKADWQGMTFRVVAYKDTGTYVIGGTDDVQALLDDHIVKVGSCGDYLVELVLSQCSSRNACACRTWQASAARFPYRARG